MLSRGNVLRYITKEDRIPIYNCKISELNFQYRSYDWVCKTDMMNKIYIILLINR